MTRKQRKDQRHSSKGGPSGPSDRNWQPPRRALSLSESFGYAWAGVCYFFSSQRNARVHAVFAVVVLAASVLLGVSTVELAVIVGVIGLVFVAEMFNTVTEAVVDLATQQWHPLAKVAKDVGAAAVLTAAIVAVVIGLLILVPHVVSYVATLTRPT